MNAPGLITPDRFDAVLFDLDGVLTATAKVHAASWKEMFDSFLRRHSAATGEPFQPFDLATDYFAYVDGRPRFEGVRAFLASRRIVLPEGSPADPPKADSILSLGNRKNVLVQEAIAAGKVELFPGALPFVDWVLSQGLRTAVVSSSKNCRAILAAVQIAERFEVVVEGQVAEELGLPGKPAPDTFLKAADWLEVEPARAVVVEDALVGVQAGKAGGFGLVVGVQHGDSAAALLDHGADVVVANLTELIPASSG
ncbi:MAG TPA: beta-phosphoglucomutase family hydrolase [Gemmatales bacterium]|nr:beta-phosphoglucomutase family hydrolase [Gemmatales bacterium]HMP58681.1 beta-phosphoglucomutase family hydrolase [Gemmatales bacterium]